MMENNLFDYATKELSQDAFLCWCLNWYNYPNAPLFPMAAELFRLMGENELVAGNKVFIRQQLKNIDILVVIPEHNHVIVIEDKITSSEHDEQITRYRQQIQNFSQEERQSLELEQLPSIRTVYFKTGFHYDCDKDTDVDSRINALSLLAILERYKGISEEILDAYCDHLHRLIAWYKEYGEYKVSVLSDNFGDWNISRHSIAQHNFMRDMLRERFPKSLWEREKESYKIRIGTNVGGRPWTELTFMEQPYPESEDKYYLFWRVDTDKKGPYISLRFYEWFDKKNDEKKSRHVRTYEILRKKAQDFVLSHSEIELDWNNISGGYTGNYYETTILSICLRESLKKWEQMAETVKQQVLSITECFLAE